MHYISYYIKSEFDVDYVDISFLVTLNLGNFVMSNRIAIFEHWRNAFPRAEGFADVDS